MPKKNKRKASTSDDLRPRWGESSSFNAGPDCTRANAISARAVCGIECRCLNAQLSIEFVGRNSIRSHFCLKNNARSSRESRQHHSILKHKTDDPHNLGNLSGTTTSRRVPAKIVSESRIQPVDSCDRHKAVR